MFLSRGFRGFFDTKTRLQLAWCVPSASAQIGLGVRRSSQDPVPCGHSANYPKTERFLRGGNGLNSAVT